MSTRIDKIFSVLPKCKKFADVGCDHGYVTLKMLSSKKCESAICSDVSKPSLKKAEKLISGFDYNVKFICCNGLEKIDADCDLVLISGMGGETIIDILSASSFLPQKLVLQPMKNVDKVRIFVIKLGYKLINDFKFFAENKFYDVISLEKGKDVLTEQEVFFGRDNINNPTEDFLNYLKLDIDKKTEILLLLPEKTLEKENLQNKLIKEKLLYEDLRIKRNTK